MVLAAGAEFGASCFGDFLACVSVTRQGQQGAPVCRMPGGGGGGGGVHCWTKDPGQQDWAQQGRQVPASGILVPQLQGSAQQRLVPRAAEPTGALRSGPAKLAPKPQAPSRLASPWCLGAEWTADGTGRLFLQGQGVQCPRGGREREGRGWPSLTQTPALSLRCPVPRPQCPGLPQGPSVSWGSLGLAGGTQRRTQLSTPPGPVPGPAALCAWLLLPLGFRACGSAWVLAPPSAPLSWDPPPPGCTGVGGLVAPMCAGQAHLGPGEVWAVSRGELWQGPVLGWWASWALGLQESGPAGQWERMWGPCVGLEGTGWGLSSRRESLPTPSCGRRICGVGLTAHPPPVPHTRGLLLPCWSLGRDGSSKVLSASPTGHL